MSISLKFKTEANFQAETRIVYLSSSGINDARLGRYPIPDKENRVRGIGRDQDLPVIKIPALFLLESIRIKIDIVSVKILNLR